MNLESIPKLGFTTHSKQTDMTSEVSKASHSTMERLQVNYEIPIHKPISGKSNHNLVNLLCDLKEGPDYLMEYIKYQIFQISELSDFFKRQGQVEKQLGKSTSNNLMQMRKTTEQRKVPNNAILDSNIKVGLIEQLHGELGDLHVQLGQSFDILGQDLKGIFDGHDNSRKQLKNALEELFKKKKDQEKYFEMSKKDLELYVAKWDDAITKRIQFITDITKPQQQQQIQKRKSIFFNKPSMNSLQELESKYALKTGGKSKTFQNEITTLIAFYQNYYRIHLPKILHSMIELSTELSDRYKWAWGMYWKESRKISGQRSIIYGGFDEADPIRDLDYDFEHLMSMKEKSFELSPTEPEYDEEGRLNATLLQVIQKFDLDKDLADFIRFSYNNNEKNFLEHIDEMHVVTKNDSRVMNEEPSDVILSNFGVDLQYLCDRDDVNVPRFFEDLLHALDRYYERQDIYQSTESLDKIMSLRNQLNKHAPSVEYRNVTMPLLCDMVQLYLRELPESLIPVDMIQEFMAAVKTEDARRKIINIHDCVNRLPDSHYCTLKVLMVHLQK